RWNAKGQLDRRAVLVGGGQPAADIISALEASHGIDVTIAGIFDDRDNERSPELVSGYRKLGNTNELIDFVRKSRVDLLIVTLPLTAETRLLDVVKRLWVLPVDIRLSAYTQRMRYRPRAYSYIGNVPFLDVFDKPLSDWGQVVKWIEDKVISALALLLLSPLMLIVAAAIKLDSKGPVFFKQRRFGFNNELIEVYKFRSMYTNMSDANAAKLVTKDDPRVTRVGRFIRKTSLDELPQLINVLKGELSLVGPRPHATHAKAQDRLYDEAVEGYFARHRVKPGITGWAQVNGWRGETDTLEKIQRRVEHDLYYIENWSVLFDLYILARTPISLLNSENAY
ncbi:MAG: undecaprenyl-phosphate glucose phosphotransferase, partial [Parvibaculaceae bacterium]